MPVQIINNQSITTNNAYKNNTLDSFSGVPSWVEPDIYISPKVSKKVKMGVFLSTVAGTSLALALLMKGKYSLNPVKILKTSPKNWGLWNKDYKEKEILAIAAGSVGGGLLGGALFDKKENMKAKFREAVIQYIGNVAVPLGCVSVGIHQFNKVEGKILKHINFPKGTSKIAQCIKKILKSLPGVATTLLSLGVGIILGNRVGNFINEKIFKVKDNRKIKATDFSPHVDDLCLAITLKDESTIGHLISRVIPAALMVAGVSTGVAQEKPERCKHEAIESKSAKK